jgi:hypothetical protein
METFHHLRFAKPAQTANISVSHSVWRNGFVPNGSPSVTTMSDQIKDGVDRDEDHDNNSNGLQSAPHNLEE